MTSVTGAIIRLIQLISVTWSSAVYSAKIMGILSQHIPIPTASVKLEKDVMSLTIILILVLVTVLPFKDVNKEVMSQFSLPKYGCIHFIFSYIHMLLTWTFNHLIYVSCTITLITLPCCYLMTQTCLPVYTTLLLRRRPLSLFSCIFRLNTVAFHNPLVWVLLKSYWTKPLKVFIDNLVLLDLFLSLIANLLHI